MLQLLCFIVLSLPLVTGFDVNHVVNHRVQLMRRRLPPTSSSPSQSTLRMTASPDNTQNDVEDYLNTNHPIFVQALLSKNDKVWKSIRQPNSQATIFAPTDAVFVELGDKARLQFADDRNRETVEKMAAYHVVSEPVTAEQLFASGGVVTLGGTIPVDRSVSGGFFGIGGKEDGGVTINGAKVTETIEIGDTIIHVVDKVVSPNVLWRYMDQLRIPGSS